MAVFVVSLIVLGILVALAVTARKKDGFETAAPANKNTNNQAPPEVADTGEPVNPKTKSSDEEAAVPVIRPGTKTMKTSSSSSSSSKDKDMDMEMRERKMRDMFKRLRATSRVREG